MKRILVVDDELTILCGLFKALQELCDFKGEIRTVVNGREAIREISLCFYDICFLDIILADINGFEVMRDINEISPATNIILMSASHLHDDLKKTVDEGEAFYIEKPFDFPRIKNILKLALDGDGDFYRNRGTDKQKGMQWRRRFNRRPLTKTLSFSISDFQNIKFSGGIVDISSEGVGIETYYPLERGHLIRFNNGIAHKSGIVAWSNGKAGDHFTAGVKFI